MIELFDGMPGAGMMFTLTAPRGFFDPTRPYIVVRSFPDQQCFNAYVSVLEAEGLRIDFKDICHATYVRSDALTRYHAEVKA